MHYPSFSIVVPSYNQAPFLRECLDSILSQRQAGVDVEVIVIDGGSADASAQIIREYAPQLNYWVSEPDRGQTHALNKGFERSTGQILGWLNSDDVLLPGALRTVAEFFQQRPEVDVGYGDVIFVDPAGRCVTYRREIEFDLEIFLWDYNYMPQPSTFWTRRIWQLSGGLDESIQCAMDFDLWLKFIKAGGRPVHIPQALSKFRFYPEQKNQRLRGVSDAEDWLLRERFLSRTPSPFERRWKHVWHKTRRVLKRAASGAYWAAPPSPEQQNAAA